jgi:hypothetical protein
MRTACCAWSCAANGLREVDAERVDNAIPATLPP